MGKKSATREYVKATVALMAAMERHSTPDQLALAKQVHAELSDRFKAETQAIQALLREPYPRWDSNPD